MLIDICMKFREDSFRGFQVTERTRFVTDRQTDGQTDRQTDRRMPGEKQYVSQPFGGRHNKIEKLQRGALKLILGNDYTTLDSARKQMRTLSFEETIFLNSNLLASTRRVLNFFE